MDGKAQDRAQAHPRHARRGDARRPAGGDEPAPGAHGRDPRRRPAEPAAPRQAAAAVQRLCRPHPGHLQVQGRAGDGLTVQVRFSVREISFFEREVRVRLPFRCGVVTLTSAPQAFVRARIALEDGKEDEGAAAEMLVPKWFDKDPALSNAQNIDQLRASLALARDAYLAAGDNTAFGHWIDNYGPQIALGAAQGMNSLTACFGPALIDRALLDALCRALGVSFYEAIRSHLPGISAPGWQTDLAAFDMDEFLSQLSPATKIAARHTVGLLDPVTPAARKGNDRH